MLVRALADHAAGAMANARLIEALDASSRALAERAEVERSLREITARISAARDLPAILQLGVDEAARLMGGNGARIDLIDPRSGVLRWAYASGSVRPDDSEIEADASEEELEKGLAGQAVVHGRPFWTGDYVPDTTFPHGTGADAYVELHGIHSVMSAPMSGDEGPIGALTVFSPRRDAWNEADAGLLEHDRRSGRDRSPDDPAHRGARPLARGARSPGRSRTGAPRDRRTDHRVARSVGDPSATSSPMPAASSTPTASILDLLDPATGNLHWALDDGLGGHFSDEERAQLWISVGVGATGMAVAEDRVIVADDDLAEQFPPSPSRPRSTSGPASVR